MFDAIIANDLTVIRDRNIVLQGLRFSLAKGKVTGLIGPSGSGKTTLMRAIVGAQRITSGGLQVLGQPAGSPELRPRIGYVTQSPAVYEDLTVAQNLAYFAAVLGQPKAVVGEVLAQVGLEPQQKQLVSTLSGGQRARVSLGVALLGKAELLVLDEPTVGLDPLLRRQLWGLFGDLAKAGVTLLISSHVMDEAEWCDDLLLLREGKVLSFSSKAALLKRTQTHTVNDAFLSLIQQGVAV
ncbi:MAG TPA: ABC transporter ATP-binding protein [Candidatus Saccharimonadales bacterium]|nr:ABC transporter ATP-binding protein [Candidatus Saccharimonadales bacterium]